jgi:hypothetical protein
MDLGYVMQVSSYYPTSAANYLVENDREENSDAKVLQKARTVQKVQVTGIDARLPNICS